MDKVYPSAREAVADIHSGSTLAVGGFGVVGVPNTLIAAILDLGSADLTVVSNNCGIENWGLGTLLQNRRIRRMVASYVGENKEFARQYLSGELEVELVPQGTLAERMRAGGSGIAAFYTATGVGTQVAEGGLPWKYDRTGRVLLASPAKEVRTFDTLGGAADFVLERALECDFGIVRAAIGDRHGNLVFNRSARNFNPLVAMSSRVAIAEVEELVDPGEIDPDAVHLPGAYIHRIVQLTGAQAADKPIEKLTVRSPERQSIRPLRRNP